MKKRLLALGCLLLALALLCGCGGGGSKSAGLPQKPSEGYALDMAGVLDRATLTDLNARGRALADAAGGAVTVVTVDRLGSRAAGEYAAAVFDAWDLGDKDVLVVLAVSDRTYYLLQGPGLAADLTDEMLAQYAWDYLERDFSNGDYTAAAANLFAALERWYQDRLAAEQGGEAPAAEAPDAAEDPAAQEPASPSPAPEKRGGFPIWAVILPALAVLALAALVVFKLTQGKSRYGRRSRPADNYHGRRRG